MLPRRRRGGSYASRRPPLANADHGQAHRGTKNLILYTTEDRDEQVANAALVDIQKDIQPALTTHNEFLKELGLPVLPSAV